MQTHTFKIPDLFSEQAAYAIANTLSAVQGVAGIRISLERNLAEVKFEQQGADAEVLQAALAQAGYQSVKVPNRDEGGCCGACGG